MALTADDYLQQLLALLPYGPAWTHDEGAGLTDLLAGQAEALARLSGRLEALLAESDPRTTSELLADWERVAGLPDVCVAAFDDEQGVAQRLQALIGRLTAIGSQTPAYYIAVAESLGYVVELEEFGEHSVEDDVDSSVTGPEWASVWQLTAAATAAHEITVDDTVEDALSWWGNALLECVLNRIKPAHTTLLFNYL